MNLYIIIIFIVIYILFATQKNLFKKIIIKETNTIGIIENNFNIQYFIVLFLKLLDKDLINIKKYDSYKSLLIDLNNNTIQFGLLPENNLMESTLGLSGYKNNILKDLRFVTGLYYNYQYFFTNIIYRDENKSLEVVNVSDLRNYYNIYKRHLVIGTEGFNSESFYGLLILLYMYKLNPVNIDKYDENTEYSENTVFYKSGELNEILDLFYRNKIDGVFIISTYNLGKIRDLLDKKNVIFLDVTYDTTIFNDIFSNYYYNKTISISNKEEDLDSSYTFQTKASRILLVSNSYVNDTIVNIIIVNNIIYKFLLYY